VPHFVWELARKKPRRAAEQTRVAEARWELASC
jgi:hypothetical protein